MFMQEYEIHLINGSVIPAMEPMELEGSKSLIDRFANGDPDEVFCVGDYASGYAVVPARSIVYISTGGVHEIEDDDRAQRHEELRRKCFHNAYLSLPPGRRYQKRLSHGICLQVSCESLTYCYATPMPAGKGSDC